MDLIGALDWTRYIGVINSASDTFNKDIVIWERSQFRISRDGDEVTDEQYAHIQLKCLMNNNDFRTWPITQNTETGEIDIQNMVMILNVEYLRTQGYLTTMGRFDYNQAADRFIHQGLRYKAEGDTSIAQANGQYLLFQVILKREELSTGQESEILIAPDSGANTGFDYTLPFFLS
jgi:hypothetical protein